MLEGWKLGQGGRRLQVQRSPSVGLRRGLTERTGGGTDEQLRVGSSEANTEPKLLRGQVQVIKVIMQHLLSIVQASGDLRFG